MIKIVALLCISTSLILAYNNQTPITQLDTRNNDSPNNIQISQYSQNQSKLTHLTETINAMNHIHITTKNGQVITSKDDYLEVDIRIHGGGINFSTFQGYQNHISYEGTGNIRGRGNSTWTREKKPYKIKLDEKVSLFGMKAEKDWVLLANHFDPTLMLNATAMKIGQQLNIDYVNNIVPVNLTINGKYMGQYNLTEQVEVKKNRINVKGGVLLELDRYFNDENKFTSAVYKLPVNIKYPKHVDDTSFAKIQKDFYRLERLMSADDYPHNNYGRYFDKKAFARYCIVYLLSANREIEQPKSIYLHQEKGSKQFVMGPIWDFDWGFGFVDGNKPHFSEYQQVLFDTVDDGVGDGLTGSVFFKRLLADPEVTDLIKEAWLEYRQNHFADLLRYLDLYHDNQRSSRAKDYQLWQTGSGNIDADYQLLRTWLEKRAEFLDNYLEKLYSESNEK